MYWNHRIVDMRVKPEHDSWLELREVYYDGEKLIGHADICAGSETVEGLGVQVTRWYDALQRPILNVGDFPEDSQLYEPFKPEADDADYDAPINDDEDVETRAHEPDCPANDGFGCRCGEEPVIPQYNQPLEEQMLELVGPPCKTFEPGCPCCDAWHMFDCQAILPLWEELAEVRGDIAEWEDEEKARSETAAGEDE